ncbi:hypothetical protein BY458DRAFT_581700 [Sporodiniella umbellata]|nr:hypothetical protein BY458DRAFT_581700 [Sporodiniella umbellata]
MSIDSDCLQESDEEQFSPEEDSCSSSPSIPDEDINFDLVYALHTFTATVEGQASVMKGDALVLMEDTNIYWWLVQVLNTREVGYIPAENIETPYERLARLNKHRNREITSPSLHDIPLINLHPLAGQSRHVTIGGDCKVFCYEVESEIEEEEEEEGDDTDSEGSVEADSHYVEMNMEEDISREEEEEGSQEIRVFSGNIGQGTLFYPFLINHQTSTEALVSWAKDRFGVKEEEGSTPIEHYVAVQGLDGDGYILSSQDKPLSIFKTLTNSFTTPMPSLSNYRRISQQSVGSAGKRPRSSSFSHYEETSHGEDAVIRFYLHQRIKRAHESLTYIKVALYPDTFKRKPYEMDRMDKVIGIQHEFTIGQVIQMALEKFHVPDAEHNLSNQHKTYEMFVKSRHGKGAIEIGLNHKKEMSEVFQSLSSNGIASELLFILRKAGHQHKYHFVQERRPSILDILMDSAPKEKTRSEERGINSSSLFHFHRRSSIPNTTDVISMTKSNTALTSEKKSLKHHFKRLVGWGSHAKRHPVSTLEPCIVQEARPKPVEKPVVVKEARKEEEVKMDPVVRMIEQEEEKAGENNPQEQEEEGVSQENIAPPAPINRELDDLYLLVAHGVDFLQTREDSRWEEGGGYEFHPWNRPQSSFAVRSAHKTRYMPALMHPEPLSPPLTPHHPLSNEPASPSTLVSQDPDDLPIKPSAVDDQELERIVASHIVF